MKIEVLGSGCANCKRLEENVSKALESEGKRAEIVKVTDIAAIIGYGVLSTPALVIDGKVKVAGRIPDVQEIRGWLK